MTNSELYNLKRIAWKLLVFIILLVALDFVVGSILDYFYWNNNADKRSRHLQYTLNEADPQLIVMGSSHAMRSIDPEILENKTGMTSYNASQAAQSILFQDAILPILLKRYKPEVILLEIAPWELEYESVHYDRLSFLLPYYQNYPEVRPVIQKRSRFERMKLLSRIYPYNSDILTILQGLVKDHRTPLDNGFETYPRLMKIEPGDTLSVGDSIQFTELAHKPEIDTLKVAALKHFIKIAKDSGVTVIIVMTPVYKPFIKNRPSLEMVHKILDDEIVPLLNFSHHEVFLDHPEYFYDVVHLNTEGARIFSSELADSLNYVLKWQITDSTLTNTAPDHENSSSRRFQ